MKDLNSADGLEVDELGPVTERVGLALPLEALRVDVSLGVVVEQFEFNVLGLASLDHNVQLIGILNEALRGGGGVLVCGAGLVDGLLEEPECRREKRTLLANDKSSAIWWWSGDGGDFT